MSQQQLYTSVIVIGAAGNSGIEISKSLLNYPNINLTLYVRNEEKVASLKEKGANVIIGDVLTASEDDLLDILTGKEVLITALAALPDLILEGQLKLIKAAKKAGVKKFVPTTYGLNFNRFKPEEVIVNSAKYQVAQALKESGLEYVQVHVGVFAHYASLMLFKFNKETNTVHYNGDLNEKVDISFLEDVGKFVAEASIRKNIVGDIDVKSDTLTVREVAQIIHPHENVQFKQDQTIESWLDSIQKGIAEKSNSPQELFPILLEQLNWAFLSGRARPQGSGDNSLFENIQTRPFKTFHQH